MLLSLSLFACNPDPDKKDDPDKTIDIKELKDACNYIQGGGANATGGNGGTIYYVTTLTDELDEDGSYPIGSLRYAIHQSGRRVIMFAVSGTIHLTRELSIKNGDVTILGQSAPNGGICIADYPVVIRDNNVIIRFVRFRMGDQAGVEGDALSCYNAKNIVIDHCSFSWSTDECVSCYGNTDFTLQYCFITESLRKSVHLKGNHGYGGIWGGTNATFHHNLLAHHDSRNPRFDHDYVNSSERGPLDFVNNVVYNWGSNSAYGAESEKEARKINFVGNYYKPGPATASSAKSRLLNVTTYCTNCTKSGIVKPGSFYLADNYMFGSSSVTADNWSGVILDSKGSAKMSDCKSSTRHSTPYSLPSETATEAYEKVLAKAGCSFHRDAIDSRIVEEVKNGISTYKGSNGSTGGLIDTPSDVGGYPDYTLGYKRADINGNELMDSDSDGISDDFEDKFGLDKNNFMDGRASTLVEGLSNLEVYLNYIVKDLY